MELPMPTKNPSMMAKVNGRRMSTCKPLPGLLISLIAGDGLELRPSGLIGSLVGAVLVTAGWQWWQRRSAQPRS